MKSKSDRLPKFRNLEPGPGPVVQKDPRLWVKKLHGLPYWFSPFAADLVVQPFFTARATDEASRQGLTAGFAVQLSQWEILELRSRENPWHPSGRLDRLTVRRNDGWRTVTLVLKFSGEGEPIQCVSVIAENGVAVLKPPANTKYKGPRLAGDSRSGITGNARKHT